MIAGSVNAITLLGFEQIAVSHLTGTATMLSVSMMDGDSQLAMHLLLIIASFVAGAVVSGAITGSDALKLGRRYTVALLVEAILLTFAMVALDAELSYGQFFASAACGLQNGLASTYSGAIIRTTHMTGLFTDIGTMIGAQWRGQSLDRRRLILYVTLISGFLVGSIAGSYGFYVGKYHALAAPAAATIVLAIVYWVYSHQHQPT